MSENVAPTNITTTTTTRLGKDERQDLTTSKPISVEQYQTTTGTGTSGHYPVMQEGQEGQVQGQGYGREGRDTQSTMEKIKNMTIGSGHHEKDTRQYGGIGRHEAGTYQTPQETTRIPMQSEEKRQEQTYETMKSTDDEHQVLEITGEDFSNLKINLIRGMEGCGVRIKSWTEDASTNIRHILSGPNALEVVSNQQKYIQALNQENLYCVTIPKRSEHHEKKFIPQGYALCWEFTLQSHDVEFIMKEILQDDNHLVRHTVIGKQLCQSGVRIQGKWEVNGDTNVILVWNNSYSKLTSKKIDFRMALVSV